MGEPITIVRMNIAHLRGLLDNATDPKTREMISRRLGEQEAKLAGLEKRERKTK